MDLKALKNNTLFQIVMWQCVGQLVSGLTANTTTELSHKMNSAFPNEELSPEELASAVNRGFKDKGDAESEAKNSGIDASKFEVLTRLAGSAPGAGELAEALRRGIIPYDAGGADGVGFVQGIRQGNLANKWADMIKQLSVMWPSPSDALDALLEGQISEGEAKELFRKFGGDSDYFTMLFNTRGSAPTPTEAADMANRGIIPWEGNGAGVVSFKQAFLEGPWRNKWEPAFKKAAEYIPPPRTITAMVREGSMTDEEATDYLKRNGLDAELAAAYIKSAHKTKTEDAKKLAVGTICNLYNDRLISDSEAVGNLTALGYSQKDSEYIIAVQDMSKAESMMNKVITRVEDLYVNRNIDKSETVTALSKLGLQTKQVTDIIDYCDLERVSNVKHATQSEIRESFKYGILSQIEATNKLIQMGYTPYDSWLMLSVTMKKALPDKPVKTT